jgi:cell wall-associated NlpC family hydrolase
MATYPQPGDFALTKIYGLTGAAISVGQHIIGDGSPVQHALVYVGNGEVVQAMPGGAELIPLEDASAPVIWSTGRIILTAADRIRIVSAARGLVGTPYSFLDYASIGLAHFRVRPRWVRDFVADSGHLICSQLVDEAYLRAGVRLFDDGRLPGDVTPGDLWWLLQRDRRVSSTDRDLWGLAHG